MNRITTEYTEHVYVYEVIERSFKEWSYQLETIGYHESKSRYKRTVMKEIREKYNRTGLRIKLVREKDITYKVDRDALIDFIVKNGTVEVNEYESEARDS